MSQFASAQTIIQDFERFSPKSLAVEGDKIGLQLGSLSKRVKRVMVALDVLESVVDEAIEQGVDLIIAHHPIIFRPIKRLDLDTGYGRMIAKLIKHDITVYAAHTNLDVAKGGVNDWLAEAIGIKEAEVLVPTTEDPLKKIVVFVPEEAADAVREAMGQAGAGHIGNYSHCAFQSKGTGTFRPEEGTTPYIGEQGKLEVVHEVKVESIMPASIEKQVIRAAKKAHPYEEMAYDLYPVDNKGEVLGLGRIGKLGHEMTLQAFSEHVKQVLDVPTLRVVGDLNATVKKVAVLGGDGNKYVGHALRKGADVYVTGDVYYHVAHDALFDGLNLVDPGHNVEKVMKEGVKRYLERMLEERKSKTDVIVSKQHTDPFQFV